MAVGTEKFIFYHVPKTGGSWVKKAIRNAGVVYREAPVRKWRHPLAPMISYTHTEPDCIPFRHKEGKFSFCIVRYPVSWYKSFWCDQQRAKTGKIKWWIDELAREDCDTFTNHILDRCPFVTELYGYYVDKVDFVGKLETVYDSLVYALVTAGEPFHVKRLKATPPANVSGTERERAILSDATIQRILNAERLVIDRFYGD